MRANSTSVSFVLDKHEVRDYIRYTLIDSPRAKRGLWIERLVVLLLIATPLGVSDAVDSSGSRAASALVLGLGILLPVAYVMPWLFRRARVELMMIRQIGSPYILGNWRFTVLEEGLDYEHDASSGLLKWGVLHHVESWSKGVYVFTGKNIAYVIPASAFATEVEAGEFVAGVTQRLEAAKSNAVAPR